MNLDRASIEYAYLDVELDVAPAGVALEVSFAEGAFVAWSWVDGTTTEVGPGVWHVTGRHLVAGPDAPSPGAATVLALGRNTCRWRLTGVTPEKPLRDAADVRVS